MNKCVICEEEKDAGIRLQMLFICATCEENMIQTDAREQKYQYYINKLKNKDTPHCIL